MFPTFATRVMMFIVLQKNLPAALSMPMTVFHMVSVQGIEPGPHEGDLLHTW
jgi:hypothetical protein